MRTHRTSLARTQITGATLAELSALEGLTTLRLDGAKITDGAVSNLVKLASLENLELSHTYIDDRGLKELGGLRKLELLNVNETRASEAAVSAFDQAHPHVMVSHSGWLDLPEAREE